jgi:hypothetical protein
LLRPAAHHPPKGDRPLPRRLHAVYNRNLSAKGACRHHRDEMAVRMPSAGIYSDIFFSLIISFFSLTITQLSPVGALHVVNVRTSRPCKTNWVIS